MVDLEVDPPGDEVPINSFMRLQKKNKSAKEHSYSVHRGGDLQKMIVSNLMLQGWRLCRIQQCID